MSLTAAMPIQRNRDKMQPPIVPRRPKLAERLRNAQSALYDELLQGRARYILLGRLAATTMDSSLVADTGICISEQQHILVLRRGNDLRCKKYPTRAGSVPHLHPQQDHVAETNRVPPTKEGKPILRDTWDSRRRWWTSLASMPRLSSSQTSIPLLPACAAAVQTSHPSHLNYADLLTLVSWSLSKRLVTLPCGTAAPTEASEWTHPTFPSSRGYSVVTFAVPNFTSLRPNSILLCLHRLGPDIPVQNATPVQKRVQIELFAPLVSWSPLWSTHCRSLSIKDGLHLRPRRPNSDNTSAHSLPGSPVWLWDVAGLDTRQSSCR